MATDTKAPDSICYLGFLIRQHCRLNGVALEDVAKAIGRHPSQLTRICNGARASFSHAEIQRLAAAVTQDPQERAGLVAAWLLDQCPPGYRPFIRIEAVELASPAP